MLSRTRQKGLSLAPDRADRVVLHAQPLRDRVTCGTSFVGSVRQLTEIADSVHYADDRGVSQCLFASIPPRRLGFHPNTCGYIERSSIQALQRITPCRFVLPGNYQRARLALPQPPQKSHQRLPRQPIDTRCHDIRSPPFRVLLHGGCQALGCEFVPLPDDRQRDFQHVEPIGFVGRPPDECRMCTYSAFQNVQVIHEIDPARPRSMRRSPYSAPVEPESTDLHPSPGEQPSITVSPAGHKLNGTA